MRGDEVDQGSVFSYISAEKRVPADHPLRKVRALVDAALAKLSKDFDRMYSEVGRPSIPQTVALAQERGLTSDEHFSVDGTLLEAWAGQKSFRPKDGGGGSGDGSDFRGQKRRNDTHASKTDPDSRLFRKGPSQESKLSYMGHVVIENRNALVMRCVATHAANRD